MPSGRVVCNGGGFRETKSGERCALKIDLLILQFWLNVSCCEASECVLEVWMAVIRDWG